MPRKPRTTLRRACHAESPGTPSVEVDKEEVTEIVAVWGWIRYRSRVEICEILLWTRLFCCSGLASIVVSYGTIPT